MEMGGILGTLCHNCVFDYQQRVLKNVSSSGYPLRGRETIELSWKKYNTKCENVYYKDISFFILNILNFTVSSADPEEGPKL